ncbi:hypothetical protein [Mesorhizobium marinum]|uniref:Uncharacterized protein n=1 Tax=Mesorhizobium marinum TaxID=3228790 RepID=A0ABV3R0T4_9HYPH
MKALLFLVLVLASVGPASTQSRYDRKLEAAAMAIVAAKMGDLRGGFGLNDKPVIVFRRDEIIMGTTDMKAVLPPPESVTHTAEHATGLRAAF